MKKMFFAGLLPVLMAISWPLFSQNVNYNLQLRSTLDFPGQTLANVCGYAQNGREYALLGASKGLIIVDVTNPDVPVTIEQIPGPDNLWKEIKVYNQYAYVTSEGGQGVQILDLSTLPAAGVIHHQYTGDGAISGALNTIHALHIDVTKGFMYLYGTNLFSGGAVICDLKQDPYNPVYVGKYDENNYIHDGYVDNDTLYAAHITNGFLSMVDMTDKNNPEVLGTVVTPGAFTHNSWILSDRKTILTTDEDFPSYVAAYDVSDPTNIKELDRFSTGDGFNSIGHNTHILNDYAITSWYIDGFNILDAHRPENLIQVARYDTYAGTGTFDGCWGVYPYLPSGNIIASNIPNIGNGQGKMFICSPTYVRACYVEGTVLDGCDGTPLVGAQIEILGGNQIEKAFSNNQGLYKTGQSIPGTFTVKISKSGYQDQVINLMLVPGEVSTFNATLTVQNAVDITGDLMGEVDGNLVELPSTNFYLSNGAQTYALQTNSQGKFNLDCIPAGSYKAALWGYLETVVEIPESGAYIFQLTPGYYDDFEFDLGWAKTGTAVAGTWVLGEPIGTTFQTGLFANPEDDVITDDNDQCYMTGNGGGSQGNDDVDNGSAILTTPLVKLAGYEDAIVRFWYWFTNAGGNSTPNDNITVEVTNGVQTATILTNNISESAWRYSGDIHLKDFIPMGDNIRIRVSTADQPQPTAHVVEAGLDVFELIPVPIQTSVDAIDQQIQMRAMPNPSSDGFLLHYEGFSGGNAVLEIRNVLGQLMESYPVDTATGSIWCGKQLSDGMYFANLRSTKGSSAVLKLIVQH